MRRMCGRCVKDGVVSTHSQKVCDPVSGEVVCAPRRRVGNSGPLPLPAPNSGNPPLVGLVCGATSTRAALVLVAPHKARWCGATLPRTTFACAWCVARSTCQGLVRCGGLHRGGGPAPRPCPWLSSAPAGGAGVGGASGSAAPSMHASGHPLRPACEAAVHGTGLALALGQPEGQRAPHCHGP